jgi:hypothetical protein
MSDHWQGETHRRATLDAVEGLVYVCCEREREREREGGGVKS